MKIKFLPDHVINQIAAGEVIEDPSSVIKELVENALDAKASKIQIQIKASGMSLIRISDDGIGMDKEDLQLCLKRHATSKIDTFDDLLEINTMGFRGEALASIASISKMKIESAKGTSHAIFCEKGKILKIEPCSRTKGTLIEVRNLFYNVPVRKKFQKSISFLLSDIVRTTNQLALANPDVEISLTSENKKIIHTKMVAGSFKEQLKIRIKETLKDNITSNLNWIDYKEGPIRIKGFLGSALFTKKNRTGQYLFLNKRSIFSNFISEAVKEGYGTRIDEKHFPIFVLHVFLDNNFVDVNVHPQKKQIRLKEKLFIRETIQKAVSSSFQRENTNISFSCPLEFHKNEENSSQENVSQENLFQENSFQENSSQENSFQKNVFQEYEQKKLFSYNNFKENNKTELKEIALLGHYFLMQPLSYAVDEKIIIVDLKAANACYIFDHTHKALKKEIKEKMPMQMLAFPLILDLMQEEMILIEELKDTFFNMGFEIRTITNNTIAIDAIPYFLDKEDYLDVFTMILQEMNVFKKSQSVIKIFEKKLAQKICKFVKTRKKRYNMEEAKKLMKYLLCCEDPYHDPLGNLTMISIQLNDFAKLFANKKGEKCLF